MSDSRLKAVLTILSLVLFLYALLFASSLLLGVVVALTLWLVYLLWRLVRGVERAADALEGQDAEY
jgi:membrane protein implicated in regulation of membrane protease activity